MNYIIDIMGVFTNILPEEYRLNILSSGFDVCINEKLIYVNDVYIGNVWHNISKRVLYLYLTFRTNTDINFSKYLLYLGICSYTNKELRINFPYLLFLDLGSCKFIGAKYPDFLTYLELPWNGLSDIVEFLPYNLLYLSLNVNVARGTSTLPQYLLYLDMMYCHNAIRSNIIIPKSIVKIFGL